MVHATVGYNYKSPLLVLADSREITQGKNRGEIRWENVTITGEVYRERVLETLKQDFRDKGFLRDTEGGSELVGKVFQQDGARVHWCGDSIGWLRENFGLKNCVTLTPRAQEKALAEWPPHSPDLTPLDFSLWALLKKLAIRKCPAGFYTKTEELVTNLKAAWDEIDQELINRVCVEGMLHRVERCIDREGGYAGK